jgi:hypothetical protein
LLPADDSGLKGDAITNINQPRLIGTSVAGNTIQIVDASGAIIGSSTILSSRFAYFEADWERPGR